MNNKIFVVINFVIFMTTIVYECVHCVTIKKSQQVICDPIDDTVLTQVLGSAYNARYMSFDKPEPENPNESEEERNKRKSNGPRSFYVDENYNKELDIEPKWPWDKMMKRKKRSLQQWECETKMHWIDLGMDHFPRYIKSVECSGGNCWFGKYRCKPKSFAIKLLRRKKDRCIVAKVGTSIGMEDTKDRVTEPRHDVPSSSGAMSTDVSLVFSNVDILIVMASRTMEEVKKIPPVQECSPI
ncbi:hypothetical protein RN001_004967 [Aquatica leii]|uniref:Uncharacterized protein n=1 Tax=Aquatica leii TaxID=1421715 RepID=A0AAN7PC91_9COLE|nr:hypothetical protein RN001_004967 [Aquatica leii]